MNAIEAIYHDIQPQLDRLNNVIRRSLHSDNDLMNSVVERYLQSKGKQIRPVLVLLAARLLGDANDNVMRSAAAVEMLHNASLIHDDVVDDTPTRRGSPTINAIWDNHIAVLVGDFFVSNALHNAIATGDLRIVDTLSSLGSLLSLGEIDQIFNARYHNITEQAYLNVISRKTASLFVACVKMGAYAVGTPTDDPRLAALAEFTEALGRCFQIKDDIFDYLSDPKDIGKPVGNDLREGKVTLPLIYALSKSHPEAEAMCTLCSKESLTDADISRLIAFAVEVGGIDYAYDVMARMRDEAVAAFTASFPADDDTVGKFIAIFDYIITRKY